MFYIYQFLWDVAGGRCQNVSGLLWCTVGTWDLTCGKRSCAVLQDKDTRIMFYVISIPGFPISGNLVCLFDSNSKWS